MALKFGTSGVRGLVTEMTDKDCYLYTSAFITYAQTKTPVESFAIAGDLRSSTPRIMKAVAFAALKADLAVDNCGFIPTPALVHYSLRKSIPCTMITGSHIPDDRNGIKFNLPWGEVLKEDEQLITRIYEELKDKENSDSCPFKKNGDFKPHINIELGKVNKQAVDEYIHRYLTYFPPGCLAGLRIVNYQHSAVARDIFPDIAKRLGAAVVDVGRSSEFIPVDTESVDNTEQLKAWVLEHGADALISADGDSDRPLLIDEFGNFVRGDILGILVSSYLQADSVSTPVSCNTALELSQNFEDVRRTRIGSPYVVHSMNQALEAGYTKVVGYEANGGFLMASDFVNVQSGNALSPLPTRDALLPILAVLTLAKQRQKSISQLVSELPKRFTYSGLIRQFPSEMGKRIVQRFETARLGFANQTLSPQFGPVKSLDFTDGARVQFENGDIIHFRPSGNAPEFRCYTESDSQEHAKAINEQALKIIRKLDLAEIQTGKGTDHLNESAERSSPHLTNIDLMNKAIATGDGMDIIIVSTTSEYQEAFWQQRLQETCGQITNVDSLILVVHEDWPGGAGNGLGTLYALSKAKEKAERLYQVDILERLKNGASVGLYHTAGKGTRLAPLPGSEVNNKPGVKLPGLVTIAGCASPITLLESVIKQTSIYGASRRGRVSVFWGDQLFIPSLDVRYKPKHQIDILCQLGKMPDCAQWKEKGLEKYGLIAVGAENNAAQIEKISHNTAVRLIQEKAISVENGIGISLGSFSITSEMTTALLEEFKNELECKKGKYDSDPHLWMPLTLNQQTYLETMAPKGVTPEATKKHYQRMMNFKNRFLQRYPNVQIFGAVDIGDESFWWDYGNLKAFMKNTIKLASSSLEAYAMRQFFNIDDSFNLSNLNNDVVVEKSYILNSKIGRGNIKNSLIIGANVDYLDVEDCVIIMVSAPKIAAKASLFYNIIDDKELIYSQNTVRADCVLSNSTHYAMLTTLDRDGGQDWNIRLPSNKISYKELYDLNQESDIASVEAVTKELHERNIQNRSSLKG